MTFFTPPSIESNNSKCCPALPEAWVQASLVCVPRTTVSVDPEFVNLTADIVRIIARLCFSGVCVFRVRVWGACRTCRSFGYGYVSVTEVTEVHLALWNRRTELTEVPAGHETCFLPAVRLVPFLFRVRVTGYSH